MKLENWSNVCSREKFSNFRESFHELFSEETHLILSDESYNHLKKKYHEVKASDKEEYISDITKRVTVWDIMQEEPFILYGEPVRIVKCVLNPDPDADSVFDEIVVEYREIKYYFYDVDLDKDEDYSIKIKVAENRQTKEQELADYEDIFKLAGKEA
jgi:hypothetical protein